MKNYNIIQKNKAYDQFITKKFQKKETKCYEIFASQKTPCEHCLAHQTNRLAVTAKWLGAGFHFEKEFEIKARFLASDHNTSSPLYVVHYRDITVQKDLQKSLANAEKLAAIGKLAGGIAHEINSPLAGILAFTQVLLLEIENETSREDLEQIEIAAKMCKEIVENLLSFAHQETKIEKRSTVHVIEELHKTIRLARGLLHKKHIKVIWNILDENEDSILGNSGQVGQIFLNLIINAIQAMDEGGSIEIMREKDSHFVTLLIQDTGCGIHSDIIDKIFDPFFTTKPIGEGTGLGLSVTYSLVKQHGGEISVSSTVNMGTTFKIKFPKKTKSEI